MEGMTTREAAERWGITERSVQIHCQKGYGYLADDSGVLRGSQG